MNANPPNVTWLADASRDLDQALIKQASGELIQVFGRSGAKEIVVTQRFKGYSDKPHQKLIIAVEVQFTGGSKAHVVKLGNTKHVDGDCKGWEECATRYGIASRMFIAPISELISESRQAVIYSDVYQYYYNNGRSDTPQELEYVVERSITSNIPTYSSVERVLAQVFTEAHRCFYSQAKADATAQSVLSGLSSALREGESDSVFAVWQKPEFLQLRRDVAWLTSVHRAPGSLDRPEYIDAVDYMRRAVSGHALPSESSECSEGESGNGDVKISFHPESKSDDHPTAEGASCAGVGVIIPEMLIGPAHGDLHGRNIIVGTMRDEAEWPAVFDFDKMSTRNIVAWDFAKLEVELKCRLFQQLLDTADERDQLRTLFDMPKRPPLPPTLKLTPTESSIQQRAEILELIFAIERRLDHWTQQIKRESLAKQINASFTLPIPATTPVGRAMQIIFRIRKEASVFLGFERQREDRWLAEYYFALASFGVVSAKWHAVNDHLAWALVSAGVACANLQYTWPSSIDEPCDVDLAVTYLQLLPYSHGCWKRGKPAEPIELLRRGIQRFPYAVGLNQQLALCLAASESEAHRAEAEREVSSISKLAVVFRDFETLCRLGRVYKDRGDAENNAEPGGKFSYHDMIEMQLPAYQHYRAAFEYYHTAFEVSQNYYPGINAATLALLIGDSARQQQLAQAVLGCCAQVDLVGQDSIWVLASEGEAALLLGDVTSAIRFYSSAISKTLEQETGIIQSMYNQLCRLHWALGQETVGPIVKLFADLGRLKEIKPGPFGDCGRNQQVTSVSIS